MACWNDVMAQNHGRPRMLLALIDDTDELPFRLIRLHQSMCILYVFPLENFLDVDFERAILKLLKSSVHQLISKPALVLFISASKRTPFISDPLLDEIAKVRFGISDL